MSNINMKRLLFLNIFITMLLSSFCKESASDEVDINKRNLTIVASILDKIINLGDNIRKEEHEKISDPDTPARKISFPNWAKQSLDKIKSYNRFLKKKKQLKDDQVDIFNSIIETLNGTRFSKDLPTK